MSDTDRPLSRANEGPVEKKAGLPSARPESPASLPAAAPRGEGLAKASRPKSAKPTPVRAVAEAPQAPPSPTEPDLDEARIDVDGVAWTVRVLGRSGSPGAGETPLLLLGFECESSELAPGAREALVVGRTLKELSEASLQNAFEGSVEPPDKGRERPAAAAKQGGSGRRGRS